MARCHNYIHYRSRKEKDPLEALEQWYDGYCNYIKDKTIDLPKAEDCPQFFRSLPKYIRKWDEKINGKK